MKQLLAQKQRLNLAPMFSPKSIAIIGASGNREKIGSIPLLKLIKSGYIGKIYPVNPGYKEIEGFRCYEEIDSLPIDIDLVIIMLKAKDIPSTLENLASKSIKSAVIFSSGFAETGESEGKEIQQLITKFVEKTGIPVCGPNSLGLFNLKENMVASFTGVSFEKSSPIAFVTQSGAQGTVSYRMLGEFGGGYQYYVSSGNEAGVDFFDYVSFFANYKDIKIIGGYLEGARDFEKMDDAINFCQREDKILILLKVGSSKKRTEAAISHTGSLTGNSLIYSSFLNKKNVIQVNDEEELVDTLNLFNKAKVSPEIGGTALVTFSGGAGIIMSDKCEEFHIELADFSTGTKEKLRSLLPTFASINNPVDVTGQVTEFPDSLMESIVAILEDEGVEAVVCYMQIGDTFSYRWIPMFSEIANKTNKTFIICWAGASDKTKLLLKESNLCWFPTPTRTIRALRKLIQNKRKKAYKQQTHKVNRLTNLTKIEPHSGIMNEFICKNYLSEYGLSVPKGEIVQDEKGLIEASREIGYPIVLKVVSKDIAHKSDADVIRLNIRSESEVRKAFNEINLNARSLGRNIKIDGVLIEEMIEEGLEVIIGFIQDPLFGPCIMFGLGGVFVEVMKNIVVKQLPLNKEAALEMIKEIKYFHLLQDFRNKGFYDINALAEALVRVSEFCWDHKVWIKEFDINPLVVHKQGQGITVLDSLIIGK